MNRHALVPPSVSNKSDTCGADRHRDPTPKHTLAFAALAVTLAWADYYTRNVRTPGATYY